MLKVPISGVASFFEVSRPFVYKAIRDYGIEYKKFTAEFIRFSTGGDSGVR